MAFDTLSHIVPGFSVDGGNDDIKNQEHPKKKRPEFGHRVDFVLPKGTLEEDHKKVPNDSTIENEIEEINSLDSAYSEITDQLMESKFRYIDFTSGYTKLLDDARQLAEGDHSEFMDDEKMASATKNARAISTVLWDKIQKKIKIHEALLNFGHINKVLRSNQINQDSSKDKVDHSNTVEIYKLRMKRDYELRKAATKFLKDEAEIRQAIDKTLRKEMLEIKARHREIGLQALHKKREMLQSKTNNGKITPELKTINTEISLLETDTGELMLQTIDQAIETSKKRKETASDADRKKKKKTGRFRTIADDTPQDEETKIEDQDMTIEMTRQELAKIEKLMQIHKEEVGAETIEIPKGTMTEALRKQGKSDKDKDTHALAA